MNKVLRILMIDDSQEDVLLELHAIKKEGYVVYSERVDNEAELIKALAKDNWDLILSDYSMPHLDGIKALQTVRAFNKVLPYIIVSGTIGEEKAVRAIKDGANDYVNNVSSIFNFYITS